uniref:Uncharacterized protein n=1 Tax=Arundo donax TaxID=35708 RepID=A0A0A9AS44_ARUDO
MNSIQAVKKTVAGYP